MLNLWILFFKPIFPYIDVEGENLRKDSCFLSISAYVKSGLHISL